MLLMTSLGIQIGWFHPTVFPSNLVCSHLAIPLHKLVVIALILDLVGGFDVDVGVFSCGVDHLILCFHLLFDLLALKKIVAFLMPLKACHN
uniref:Uncharacterized protein n=1 Tax=Arundo donax TaxID=35708 RepID=A0A0A8XV84_ARUDO